MRPSALLHQVLSPCRPHVHAARLACLVAVTEGLLRRGRLSAARLGRSLRGDVAHKHGIKRVDRLLGNWRLHAERPILCAAVAHALLRDQPRPIILVDWTEVGRQQVALVAAAPIGGRALPIYFDTQPLSRLSSPKVERNFLRALQQRILPPGCTPTIVTDAGFKNAWFNAVAELGWNFVGRLALNVSVSDVVDIQTASLRSERWSSVKALFAEASSTPEDLGERIVTITNPLSARLVRHKKLPRHRVGDRRANRKGVHPGSSAYKKQQRRAKEPWVLATSLREASAAEVVGIYCRRMEIEETFRDQKNHRFGWSMQDATSRNVLRIAALLMIACLALVVQTLVGVLVEQSGMHLRYQANTLRTRRVLSHFMLGSLVLSSDENASLLRRLKPAHLDVLRPLIGHYAPSPAQGRDSRRGDP